MVVPVSTENASQVPTLVRGSEHNRRSRCPSSPAMPISGIGHDHYHQRIARLDRRADQRS